MANGPYVFDESTVGAVPSYVFAPSFAQGPGLPSMPAAAVGSMAGVPAPDQIAGSGPAGAQAAQAYGATKAQSPVHHQPLFWLFVLFVVGVVMIGSFAHFNLKTAVG